VLKCKIRDNHPDTPVSQRNATVWFQYNRSIKRGIRGYNGINVRSNYLANFAPKISKSLSENIRRDYKVFGE